MVYLSVVLLSNQSSISIFCSPRVSSLQIYFMTITKATLDPLDARTSHCLQGLCSLRSYTTCWLLLRTPQPPLEPRHWAASVSKAGQQWDGLCDHIRKICTFTIPGCNNHNHNHHTIILEFYGKVLANTIKAVFYAR